jgi:iron complex outermembrane receptor protein
MDLRVSKLPLALLCTVSLPAVAYAQADDSRVAASQTTETTAAESTQTSPDAIATPAIPEASSDQMADIVVTATRREERLQDIPVTVTAIAGNSIAESGVREVRTLTQVIPAFNGGRNQNVMQPSIRGVGSSGLSVGDEANVAVYVDGVYQGDPYSTQIDFVEVTRVEVLRGPQGTVFGRNATGGLVNVITPDPSFQTRGRVAARYGRMRENADEYDLRAYITGGVTDNVAADLALLFRKNDGYITDLARGGVLGATQVASIRSKLLVEPWEGARIIFTGAYVDSNDETASQQPYQGNSTGAPFAGVILPTEPWTASINEEAYPVSDYSRLDLSLRTSFDLGSVSLETTGAYMRTRVHQVADSDASNLRLGETYMHVRAETLTQEVRLLSNGGGPFDWILGAYVYHLEGEQPVTIINRTTPEQPIVPLMLLPTAKTMSYSAFAEGTYQLADPLFLTVGARYTTENREFTQSVNGTLLPFGVAEKSFKKFTYRTALRYELTDSANIYASYGTGFKSGVFNTFATSSIAVDPETIKAAEIGLKLDPTNWLRTNLSIYRYSYNDLQVTARASNNLFILQNAANAKIYGGELEVTVIPVEDLNIRAAAAYTNAKYDEFPAAQVFIPRPTGGNIVSSADVSGNWLVRTPKYTLNLGTNYAFDAGPGRAHLAANIFHSGKVYYDSLNSLQQDPYTMLSGEIGWTTADERITLRLFASNLTNAKVAQQISPGAQGTYIIYERPRRVGVGAEFRF